MTALVNKKVLITGGTGFIGSRLANALSAENEVVVVGRRPSAWPLDPKVRYTKLDIRSSELLDLITNGSFDYIFHLAANPDQKVALDDPTYDMEVNFLTTFRLLDLIKDLQSRPRFVFASSVTVYGASPDTVLSEDHSVLQPISNYGASKLSAERYLYAFVRQYGLQAITLRLFSTYGPGLRRQVIYDLIAKLANDPKELSVIGTGKEARDLTFIEDQVTNILKVVTAARYEGEVYNLASGRLYTTKEIASAIARVMRVKPKIVFSESARVFDGKAWLADVRKIRALGCRSKTSLASGLAQTVAWYTNEIKSKGK